jgi:hypothetical protein
MRNLNLNEIRAVSGGMGSGGGGGIGSTVGTRPSASAGQQNSPSSLICPPGTVPIYYRSETTTTSVRVDANGSTYITIQSRPIPGATGSLGVSSPSTTTTTSNTTTFECKPPGSSDAGPDSGSGYAFNWTGGYSENGEYVSSFSGAGSSDLQSQIASMQEFLFGTPELMEMLQSGDAGDAERALDMIALAESGIVERAQNAVNREMSCTPSNSLEG